MKSQDLLTDVEGSPEESALSAILESEIFRAAPMMRELLLYLWRHRGMPVSEYAIATEALGRRPDFDPRSDAAVRVHISRLRGKLKEFYEGEGHLFPLHLSIPVGTHQLECARTHGRAELVEPRAEKQEVRSSSPWLVRVLATSVALLVIVLAGLLARDTGETAIQPTPALPAFWRSFLSSGGAPTIVVPTPVSFLWKDSNLVARDTGVTNFSDLSASVPLRELAQRFGTPTLSQTYTVTMDVLAAVNLLQYLERHGQEVNFVASSRFGVDMAGDHNTIVLGIPGTSEHLQQLLRKTNFCIEVGASTVVHNRNPQPGEPEDYREQLQSPQRRSSPGIVAMLPSPNGSGRTLILAGRYTNSLVSLLVSSNGLEILEEQLRQSGYPQFFEMAVEAEIHENTILKVSAVGFRRLPPDPPGPNPPQG